MNSCKVIYEFTYENKIYEFIYEFAYEFNICEYSKDEFTLETNKHDMVIGVFQIWRSGCSRSER